MTILRDSTQERKNEIKGNLDTLWSELHDVGENYAETYLKWCVQKLLLNKNHREEIEIKKSIRSASTEEEKAGLQKALRKVSHRNIPRNISRLDIVHIKFGVNVGDELSDLDLDDKEITGHYGIVVKQLGFLFLVIPLTSQKQRGQSHELILENLGLPGTTTKSHVAFNKIRTVHIRRIQRIHSLPDGKLTITDPNAIKIINEALAEMCGL